MLVPPAPSLSASPGPPSSPTGRRGRLLLPTLAATLALALAGCGSIGWPQSVPTATYPPTVGAPTDDAVITTGPAPTQAAPTQTAEPAPTTSATTGLVPLSNGEVDEVVARMNEVLRSGNEDDWADFFVDDDELVEQQRRWFRGVQAVPMDVREFLPELLIARDSSEGTVVQLAFAHQISGADPSPALETYRVTFYRTPGTEALVSDVRGQNRGDAHPQLWDLTEIAVTVTDQLVLLVPTERQGDLPALLPGLESATANVILDFAPGSDRRLVVGLVDEELLRAITDDDDLAVDPAGVATLLSGLHERPASGTWSVDHAGEHSDRILLDIDVLVRDLSSGTPPGGWGLMRHEGVHALVDGAPGVAPPVWIWEGLAQWYGFRRDYIVDEAYRNVVRDAGEGPLRLPQSFDEYYYESQEAGVMAYSSSAMVFSFLESRFGFETARDVGVRLAEVDASWGDLEEVDALLLELIGMTEVELQQQWSAWAFASYG